MKAGRLGYINNYLLHDYHPFRMRRIYRTESEAHYVITLKKTSELSLVQRAIKLIDDLSGMLADSEQLICKEHNITVIGDCYRFTYQIEAYKKADQTICFDSDGVHVELLHRMGIEDAISYLRKSCNQHYMRKFSRDHKYPIWIPYDKFPEKLKRVYTRMEKPSLIEQYPDCAERFIHLIKQEAKCFDD